MQLNSNFIFASLVVGGAIVVWLTNYLPKDTKPSDMHPPKLTTDNGLIISSIRKDEDVFSFINRTSKGFDHKLYLTILGAASEFKDGDLAIGFATKDEQTRKAARQLLMNTTLHQLSLHPIVDQQLQQAIKSNIDTKQFERMASLTLAEVKHQLLNKNEVEVKQLSKGLSSDAIATLVKLMNNDELIALGQKIHHQLPDSQIGAKDYLSARIQPNSPTDDPVDILMSVLSVWSYAEGDLMLGTNPVSSNPESVKAIQDVLRDLVQSFGLEEHLPWTVLAHIDLQAKIEEEHPGSTALWFQSIAGTDDGLKTFDAPLKKLLQHAEKRRGRFALYLEAGQGGDFTNGHSLADMVTLESYKDGMALLLNRKISSSTGKRPWSVINDVAGFIGPEVFKTKDQLIRTMLEDVVLGKLHGLTYGLDVCATMHMDVSVDELREAYLKVLAARPAFTMVLPYMNDPMLSYLTTGVHQLVEARYIYGFKRNDAMEKFFQHLGVLNEDGMPNQDKFGDPVHMYWQYRLAKKDSRPKKTIEDEARSLLNQIAARGVIIPEGYGKNFWDLPEKLEIRLKEVVADSKKVLRAKLSRPFIDSLPSPFEIHTQGCQRDAQGKFQCDRELYINRPVTGEILHKDSITAIKQLRSARNAQVDVQIVVSDGLNAMSISDKGHASPYLKLLRQKLAKKGYTVANDTVVIHNGRVRAGYQVGNLLFADAKDQKNRILVHVIGERPGTGHRNFSIYVSAPSGATWASSDKATKVDHDITRVVSGVSDTALDPKDAVDDTLVIIEELMAG